MNTIEPNDIMASVQHCLQDILEDSDLDLNEPISASTFLNDDLCLSSIEVLELFGKLDLALDQRLPYDKLLMVDGSYRTELTVGELVDFACAHQSAQRPAPRGMK